MGGKTDIRWSDAEWAALERAAASWGMTPGRVAKAIVVDRLPAMTGAPIGQQVGSAAPKERESGPVGAGSVGIPAAPQGSGPGARSGTVAPAPSRSAQFEGLREAVMTNGANVPVVGAAAEARDLMGELKESFDRVRRPVGSAGSGSAVPPAAAAAAPVSSPAGAEPAGVTLLAAVVAALRAQGVRVGTELLARKAIKAGQVIVDGEACTDPDRLVDPDALG